MSTRTFQDLGYASFEEASQMTEDWWSGKIGNLRAIRGTSRECDKITPAIARNTWGVSPAGTRGGSRAQVTSEVRVEGEGSAV